MEPPTRKQQYTTNINQLPAEMMPLIFFNLPVPEIAQAALVCKS